MISNEVQTKYHRENFLRGRVNLALKLEAFVDPLLNITPISESKPFIHSSALLVLTGFKPSTFYSLPALPEAEMGSVIDNLNRMSFKRYGICHLPGSIMERKGFPNPEQQIFLLNLRALYKKINSVAIAGVPKVEAVSLEAFSKWREAIRRFDPDITGGIMYGYPDRAVLDYADAIKNGRTDRLVSAVISTPDRAVPIYSANFDLYKESLGDPSVSAYISKAGRLLGRISNKIKIVDFVQPPFHPGGGLAGL